MIGKRGDDSMEVWSPPHCPQDEVVPSDYVQDPPSPQTSPVEPGPTPPGRSDPWPPGGYEPGPKPWLTGLVVRDSQSTEGEPHEPYGKAADNVGPGPFKLHLDETVGPGPTIELKFEVVPPGPGYFKRRNPHFYVGVFCCDPA